MTSPTDQPPAQVVELKSNAEIIAAFKAGRRGSSGCACVFDEDSDTILRWCLPHSQLKDELTRLRAELAEARDEVKSVRADLDAAAQTVQEVLLRLRMSAAEPRVRESLRAMIAKGEFDGIGD